MNRFYFCLCLFEREKWTKMLVWFELCAMHIWTLRIERCLKAERIENSSFFCTLFVYLASSIPYPIFLHSIWLNRYKYERIYYKILLLLFSEIQRPMKWTNREKSIHLNESLSHIIHTVWKGKRYKYMNVLQINDKRKQTKWNETNFDIFKWNYRKR